MTRNLKALGLALLAVFALGAVAASGASAQQGFLTSTGNVTLRGTEIAGTTNALTWQGVVIKCPGSTYTGHKFNVTAHTFIPSGATTATISPQYKQANHNCRATPGNFPVTIDMNSCDFVVHLNQTTEATAEKATYGVTYDVACSNAGDKISVTEWTTEADETKPTEPFCVQHIKPQTGLLGGHATNTANGTFDLDGTVKGITIEQTASKDAPLLCTAKENALGEFDINVNVTGEKEGGGTTSVSLSHN